MTGRQLDLLTVGLPKVNLSANSLTSKLNLAGRLSAELHRVAANLAELDLVAGGGLAQLNLHRVTGVTGRHLQLHLLWLLGRLGHVKHLAAAASTTGVRNMQYLTLGHLYKMLLLLWLQLLLLGRDGDEAL